MLQSQLVTDIYNASWETNWIRLGSLDRNDDDATAIEENLIVAK